MDEYAPGNPGGFGEFAEFRKGFEHETVGSKIGGKLLGASPTTRLSKGSNRSGKDESLALSWPSLAALLLRDELSLSFSPFDNIPESRSDKP